MTTDHATPTDFLEGLRDPGLLHDQAYVGGSFVDADDASTFEVLNPATGELLARVPRMGAAETRRAIDASSRAFPAWRHATANVEGHDPKNWGVGGRPWPVDEMQD